MGLLYTLVGSLIALAFLVLANAIVLAWRSRVAGAPPSFRVAAMFRVRRDVAGIRGSAPCLVVIGMVYAMRTDDAAKAASSNVVSNAVSLTGSVGWFVHRSSPARLGSRQQPLITMAITTNL